MTDMPSSSRVVASDAAATPATSDPIVPPATTPLRARMIEDMTARNLNRHTQRSHISS